MLSLLYNHSRSVTNVTTSTNVDSLFGINMPTVDESLRSTAESYNFNMTSVSIIRLRRRVIEKVQNVPKSEENRLLYFNKNVVD